MYTLRRKKPIPGGGGIRGKVIGPRSCLFQFVSEFRFCKSVKLYLGKQGRSKKRSLKIKKEV